jgi:hypothetical protein
MSKKIIAVAAAAALALTGLVVMPTVASALGPFAVSVAVSDTLSRSGADGSTGSLELTILVPTQDVLRLDAQALPATSTSGTLLRFIVTTPAGGAAVTATAALGGAKLVTQAQVDAKGLTTASGTASISVTSDTSGLVTFYAYTTSTADSTITVASSSNSKVLYMKGVSAKVNSYKLNFTASPLATAAAGKITFTGTVTDMFGNVMTGVVADDITTTGLGGNLGAITQTDFAQSSTTGVITFTGVNRNTAGSAAISLSMSSPALTAVAGAPVKVAAYGDPVGTLFFAVSAVDLSASVTALTAQVAALTAQLAVSRLIEDSVTQKKYNTLARKWNKANPGAKVALKK